MKYIKRFSTPQSTHNIKIDNVPFVTLVDSSEQIPKCDEEDRYMYNDNGTVLVCGNFEFIGNGNWSTVANWKDSKIPTNRFERYKDNVNVKGNMTINSIVHVHNFTINSGYTVEVLDGGILYIDGVSNTQDNYGNIDVKEGGKLVIQTTGSLIVNDLILNATLADADWDGNSCEIFGIERIVVDGNCYFDCCLEPGGNVSSGYYDMCIPFEIDQPDGIIIYANGEYIPGVFRGNYLGLKMDYNISTNNWKEYRGTLYPGDMFSIYVDYITNPKQIIRLKWNKNGTIFSKNNYSVKYIRGSDYGSILVIGNPLSYISTISNLNNIYNGYIALYSHVKNGYIYTHKDIKNISSPVGSLICIATTDSSTSKTITWVPVNNLLE